MNLYKYDQVNKIRPVKKQIPIIFLVAVQTWYFSGRYQISIEEPKISMPRNIAAMCAVT